MLNLKDKTLKTSLQTTDKTVILIDENSPGKPYRNKIY